MTDRQDIAAAINAIDGFNISPSYLQTTSLNHGWIRKGPMNRAANGIGFVATWDVYIVIPSDIPAAETWLEENVDQLTDALTREMYVTTVRTVELPTDSGATVWAAVISGTR